MNRRAVVSQRRSTDSLDDDPASISAYFNEALSASDPGLFLEAIGDAVRVRGVETVNPEFLIVHEIVRALGVELAIVPGRT